MIAAPSMILVSILGALKRESSCERQEKIFDFFFGNFSDPFPDRDSGVPLFSCAKNVSRSPSRVWLAMKRRVNIPTIFLLISAFGVTSKDVLI